MQAQYLDPGHLLHHCLHHGPRRFDQMGPHLFEQVPPLFDGERFDQLLLCRCQDTLESH
jgi:hypothetical protein